MTNIRSIFLIPDNFKSLIYRQASIDLIQEMTVNDGMVHTREQILSDPASYENVEIAFSGWGSPLLDRELLDALPGLRAYFYGAGSVRSFVTDAFWKRGIVLTSAYRANAIPVAEYTVSMAIVSLKRALHFNHAIRSGVNEHTREGIPGVYRGSKVGVISLGAIGQLVSRKLVELNLDVFAYDPFAEANVFESCGARAVDAMGWLFAHCDVISLHAPWLPETEGMITAEMFRSMRDGATFINTSRGMLVDESAMIEVFRDRPEIYGVIDVIRDESTYGSTLLGQLPNVFLTPHIAGSMGRECYRMGDYALEECRRYLNGEPQQHLLTRESAKRLA